MSEKYRPDNVMVALLHLYDSLPFLVGRDWAKIAEKFDRNLEQLINNRDISEKRDLSLNLVELLKPYEETIKVLDFEIASVMNSRAAIQRNLDSLTNKFQISDENLDFCIVQILRFLPAGAEPDEVTRHIRLKPHGLNTATSMKLSNIDLSIFQIASLTGVALTTAAGAAEKLNPLIIAIGILTTILSVAQASTVKIDEQEASVLWGFILARDQDSVANCDKIMQFTNRSRTTIDLKPLETKEVKSSLNKLRLMKVVKVISDTKQTWKLIESFAITNT